MMVMLMMMIISLFHIPLVNTFMRQFLIYSLTSGGCAPSRLIMLSTILFLRTNVGVIFLDWSFRRLLLGCGDVLHPLIVSF